MYGVDWKETIGCNFTIKSVRLHIVNKACVHFSLPIMQIKDSLCSDIQRVNEVGFDFEAHVEQLPMPKEHVLDKEILNAAVQGEFIVDNQLLAEIA